MTDSKPQYEQSSVMVARNTLQNLATQALTILVSLIAAPLLVRALTEEVFGVLVIVWLVVGYLSFLDFGMSRASVKFLAEYFNKGEPGNARRVVWISILFSLSLGLIGALLLFVLAPLLVEKVLKIPATFQAPARASLNLVAIALPFVLIQGVLRSVPMSIQRFGIVNVLQAASGVLQWGGSVVLVLSGLGLVEVVAFTVAIRILGAFVLLGFVLKLLRRATGNPAATDSSILSKMIRFGGWVSVSQLVSPLIGYLDRFLIGSLVSMKALAYYAVPSEAISRLQVVPQSLSSALFPAMAERGHQETELTDVRRLYLRSLAYIVATVLPISVILSLYSKEILELWLGGDFPAQSTNVFTLLSIGIFFHAVAYVPVTALQAIGRPDITGKLNIAEVPIFVVLCLVLIPLRGIEGAALAWVLRLVLITTALLWVVEKKLSVQVEDSKMNTFKRGALLNGGLLVLLLLSKNWFSGLFAQAAILLALLTVYGAGLWIYAFDHTDRKLFARLLST